MIYRRRDEYGQTRAEAARERAAEIAAGERAMLLKRWSLNQVLAWISTRRPEAVGWDRGTEWVSVWCEVNPGCYPFPEMGDAWNELATAMANGEIFGLGTRVAMSRQGGLTANIQGVRFPPDDQPGAALTCRVFDDDQAIIAPVERAFAQAWTEHHDLTFNRVAVVEAFPPAVVQGERQPISSSPPIQGSTRNTVGSQTKCRKWLEELMANSPHEKPMPKEKYRRQAIDWFHVSNRGFNAAWAEAIRSTGARWDKAGAPKKTAEIIIAPNHRI